MKLRYLIFCLGMAFLASALRSQEFNATLTQALAKSWPTYNGDYSGRRFSELTQINTSNVISLSFAWIWRSDYNYLRPAVSSLRIQR